MADRITSAEVGGWKDMMRVVHKFLVRVEREMFMVDWVVVRRRLNHLLFLSSDLLSSSSLRRRMFYPMRLADNQSLQPLLFGIRHVFDCGII